MNNTTQTKAGTQSKPGFHIACLSDTTNATIRSLTVLFIGLLFAPPVIRTIFSNPHENILSVSVFVVDLIYVMILVYFFMSVGSYLIYKDVFRQKKKEFLVEVDRIQMQREKQGLERLPHPKEKHPSSFLNFIIGRACRD